MDHLYKLQDRHNNTTVMIFHIFLYDFEWELAVMQEAELADICITNEILVSYGTRF